MKIVDSDNFGRDYPDEKFLAKVDSDGRVVTLSFESEEAEKIVEVLNGRDRLYSHRYWKVVPDDYELQPGFEP